ncbi:MAG: FAD-containing monooxygenase EthA [Ponticaulis sp.]|nr:FAD-containing monooxygenase EthA [Ponticaulis sp.]
MSDQNFQSFDVLIVGAGLSGIGTAVHLGKECPDKSYAILEARESLGGTWDLFRYPGIRSDSDMHTLGYSFKPWLKAKAIADGPSILEYINDAADEYDVRSHIRFSQKVISADWDSNSGRWIVVCDTGDGAETRYACQYLALCSGYYRYEEGYTPAFEGASDFAGEIVHPQHWPEDLDYAGKRVVVIGSGATAVTLVPAMSDMAEHVVMLQRSPTYIVSRPSEDKIGARLRSLLPTKMAYAVTRWKNVILQRYFYNLARKRPEKVSERLVGMVKGALGENYDVETHFTPNYGPWDQRLCLIPDGDLWNAINAGKASVVTDHIERFTSKGIMLKSGEEIPADIIVTATGLDVQFFGGASLSVDGEEKPSGDLLNYKGLMYAGVPNLINVFGYVNASWTLKADLAAQYLCRLIKAVDGKGAVAATPTNTNADIELMNSLDFSSGYVERARSKTPIQAKSAPWTISQDYVSDRKTLGKAPVDDGFVKFTHMGQRVPKSVELNRSVTAS